MIWTSIEKKSKTLICDFHKSRFSFQEFRSFFDKILRQAAKYRIQRIKIIHGQEKMDENGRVLGDHIREKLLSMPYVSCVSCDPLSYLSTVVELSSGGYKMLSQDKSRLRSLLKELKKNEENEKEPKLKKKQPAPLREKPVSETLSTIVDDTWNELKICQILEDLVSKKSWKELQKAMEYLKDFEIFFSQDFAKRWNFWQEKIQEDLEY